MNRTHWKFQYKVSELLKAAREKVSFYSHRIVYWEGKKKEVIALIRSEGIDVDQSLAANDPSYSNSSVTRGGSIVIREDLQRDLQEAHNKIATHKKNLAGYEAWVELFSADHPEHVVDLDQEDWLYFFSMKS